jgi:hypothetical protein
MSSAADKSDRNYSADTPSTIDARESLARLLEQSEIAELFDTAARRRFGQMISAAVLKPAKRHRRRRAA